MAFLFHKDRFEPPLEKMADLPVFSIEGLRVGSVQLPHSGRKVSIRSFDEQMVVVGHQAVGMTDPMEVLDSCSQPFQKIGSVVIIGENILPCIATTGDERMGGVKT